MEKIKIIVDSREVALYNNIIERDFDKYKDFIEIQTDQLDLADIHISFKDRLLVFERKTVSDLLSSIKDGRYKEQKARLLSNISPNDITYIIEGDNILSSNNNNQNILSGVYTHSMYRDGIHIVFTKNVIETVTYLLILSMKIIDNCSKFIKNINNDIENDKEPELYVNNCKLKSKKICNIDTKTCYIMQLSQIPFISVVIAKNIVEKYPTLRTFLKALDECDNKLKLLCNIDKIGKNKAIKILEYFQYT